MTLLQVLKYITYLKWKITKMVFGVNKSKKKLDLKGYNIIFN